MQGQMGRPEQQPVTETFSLQKGPAKVVQLPTKLHVLWVDAKYVALLSWQPHCIIISQWPSSLSKHMPINSALKHNIELLPYTYLCVSSVHVYY